MQQVELLPPSTKVLRFGRFLKNGEDLTLLQKTL